MTYPGCQFAGASYDHSIATAVWEIGKVLGMKEDAVRMRYARAIMMLRNTVEE